MTSVVSSLRTPVIWLVFVCFLSAGCATTPEGQQQQMGAAGGAAVGALVGGLIGRDAKGALIGAAAGGLLGWGATKLYQVHTAQVRSATEEQKIYGLTTTGDSPVVKIRRAASMPEKVKPGDQVDVTTDYSVSLPKGSKEVSVEESWVLKKDGKVLSTFGPQQGTRTTGGYQTEGTIPIPEKTAAGTYVIEHKVQSGTSYDVMQSVFYVSS